MPYPDRHAYPDRFYPVVDSVAWVARLALLGVEGGRTGFEAGLMGPRDFASPSTPVIGTPFWHAVS